LDKSSLVYFRTSWSNPGGLRPDLNEPELLLSGLGIAHWPCFIVDSDQGTAGIHKGIGALELVPITCFILSDVNLILILSNLVFKVVFDLGVRTGSSSSSSSCSCFSSSTPLSLKTSSFSFCCSPLGLNPSGLCRSLGSQSLFHGSSNGRSEGRNNVGHHLVLICNR
jgi:hypothetical protein